MNQLAKYVEAGMDPRGPQPFGAEGRGPAPTDPQINPMPITAVVCTLNEAQNIIECLDSIRKNNPAEILVVDAASDDNTAAMAREAGAKVVVCARRGLAFQRDLGARRAREDLVAFVDADDVLDPDCLGRLWANMREHRCAAVQAISRSYSINTYWEKAMDSLNRLQSRQPGPTHMVGRPALYRKDILLEVGIDKDWGPIGNEDSDLAIRFELSRQAMWIGTGFSARKHARTLRQWLVKWIKYGRGDAKLLIKYPDRRRAIIGHQLINYPLKLSIEGLAKGCGRYVPFYVLFGLTRFVAMIADLILMSGQTSSPNRLKAPFLWRNDGSDCIYRQYGR